MVFGVVAFLSVFFVPPVYQAWIEWRSARDIQILHLWVDLWRTPQQRAAELRALLSAHAESLDVERVWQVARVRNRHVESDSLDPDMGDWKRLRLLAERGDSAALMDQVKHCLARWDVRNDRTAYAERFVDAVFRRTLFNRDYLRAWEKKTEEVSRFALYARPVMQWWRYRVFGDLGEKGVVGTGGLSGEEAWSFYRPGIDWLTQDPRVVPLRDDPLTAIAEFRDQLRTRGIELLVVVVPVKAAVYPDRLTPRAPRSAFSRSLAILDSLRARGIRVVDLFNAFAQERALDRDREDALYLKHDTHWRLRGVRRAAREIAASSRSILDSLCAAGHERACVLPQARYREKPCRVDRFGDILSMTQLEQASFLGRRISFRPQNVECAQVYRVNLDSAGRETDSVLYQDDFRDSRILLLGDSFSRIYQTDEPRGAGLIAHLARELGTPLSSLVSDGGASTLVREKLARKPGVLRGKSLVIWEFVERDFRFGAEGWKRVDL